jgi:hypothetical protein
MPPAIAIRRPTLGSVVRRTLTALVVVLASVACQADAAGGGGTTDGLLILSKGDTPALEILVGGANDENPVPVIVPLPAANANSIAAGGGGILAATTADGRLFVSDAVDPGGSAAALAGLDWQRADTTDGSAAFEGPAWFATWDPGGRTYALLAGDLLDGGDMRLVVVDTANPTPVEVALQRSLLAAPPAWLDADRVAVVTGTTAAPDTLVVEVASGEVNAGPAGARRIAVSGDGKVVATSGGLGAPVVIRSTRAWLAEDGTSIGTITPPEGVTEAIAIALDADGKRLAVVWLDADGVPRYDIHDGTDGWRRVFDATVPGATSAAVAWLR